MTYPDGYGRCIMCGADRDRFCTVISGPGDECPNCNGSGRVHSATEYQADPCPRCGATGKIEVPAGERPGDIRDAPHAGRPPIGSSREPAEGFMAIKDEPNHYRDQPHTAECGPDCPFRESA